MEATEATQLLFDVMGGLGLFFLGWEFCVLSPCTRVFTATSSRAAASLVRIEFGPVTRVEVVGVCWFLA